MTLPEQEKHAEQRVDQPGAVFDRDLELVESLPEPERGRYALDIYAEVTGDQSSALYRGERGLPTTTGQETWMQQYFLYDIPGPTPGDVRTIRRGYDDRHPLHLTPEHAFGMVPQGTMRVIDRERQPYLRSDMSECSILLAVQQDKLWVAHISFSMTTAAEQVVDMMDRAGVTQDQLYAVASVGAYQEQRAAANSGEFARRLTLDDYTRLGIKPDHLASFEWSVDPNDSGVSYNLAQVLVSNQSTYVKLADYRTEWRAGFLRSDQIGPDRGELVLEYSK